MKKYLVFSVIFLTSFFLISNVKADSNDGLSFDSSRFESYNLRNLNTDEEIENFFTNYYNNYKTSDWSGITISKLVTEFKTVKEKIKKQMETNNYDSYIINVGQEYSNSYTPVFRAIAFNKNDMMDNHVRFVINYLGYNYYYASIKLGIKTNSKYYYYKSEYSSYYSKFNSNSNGEVTVSSEKNYNFTDNIGDMIIIQSTVVFYPKNLINMIFTIDTDLPIYFSGLYDDKSSSDKFIKTLNVTDDKEKIWNIEQNEELISSDGLLLWKKPYKYSYENTINVKDLSKIEFNFKLPSESVFSYDLDLLTQFSESEFFMPKPYLVYQSNFNDKDISQVDDFLGDLTEVGATDEYNNELYEYSGQFGIDFSNLKQLKLVFDVSDYNYNLYIKFTSSLDYEMTTISYEEEKQYFTTIEMDDKYGLYLIPRTLSSDNLNNIVLKGKYNIEIRNNYKNSDKYDVLKKYINYTENSLNYKYTFDNLNYLIYFENVDYQTNNDDGYFITFDSRFYNYVVKENIYDSPVINNPNTNEDIKLPSTDFITGDKEDNSQSFLHNITNFLNSLRSYSKYYDELFKEINEIYNVIRKSRVGIYIFIVISGSIIILLIKGIKK